MRAVSVISAVVSVALMSLTLLAAASDFRWHLSVAAIAAGVVVVVSLLAGDRRRAKPKPEPVSAEAVKPAAIPVASNQAEAEVVSFLSLLQEKGRFVDFLMDDITPYADAQVGGGLMPVQIIGRPGDGLAQPLSQHGGVVGMLKLGLHNGKLIAAEPRNQVGVAKTAAQPLRNHLQQLVAARMTERVIDAFEVVEIEIEHRKLRAPPHKRKLPLQLLAE